MPAPAQYFCYLEPKRLTLMGNTGVSLQMVLGPDVVTDLEVVDAEKLTALIVQLLSANSVPAGSINILLSPQLLFEQETTTVPPANKEVFIQKFLDSVPFESVGSKKYAVLGKEKIIAANKEFFDCVKRGFEKKNIQIASIVPYSLLQALFPELAQSINPQFIFGKMDSFRQYSITEPDIIRPPAFDTKSGLKGRRDMILLGVFVVLMLVLGYMVTANFIFVKPVLPKRIVTPTVAPSPLIFPTTAESSKSGQQNIPTK